MFFFGRLLSGAYHKKQARAMSDALKTGRACDGSSGTRRAADFGVELGMKRNDDSLLSPNSQSIENLFYYYDSICLSSTHYRGCFWSRASVSPGYGRITACGSLSSRHGVSPSQSAHWLG